MATKIASEESLGVMVPLTSLWIPEERQRECIVDTGDLEHSIAAIGQLNPIILKTEPGPNGEKYRVMAGARRTTALRALGRTEGLCRFFDDLDPIEQELVELHENVRRQDLTWQEVVLAVRKYARLRREQGTRTTHALLAQELGYSQTQIKRFIDLGPYIEKGSPRYEERLATADTATAAHNVLLKREERAQAARTSELLSDVTSALLGDTPAGGGDSLPGADLPPLDLEGIGGVAIPSDDGEGVEGDSRASVRPAPAPARPATPIIHADFREFAAAYTGPKFSFLHCDLPYGIDFEGAQSARVDGSHHTQYDDSEDVYWSLIDAIVGNVDRLCAPQCHMFFWFDMRHYERTIQKIETRSDFRLVTPNPFVWLKSDAAGIASDTDRRPRHITEFALLFSRGDRKTFKVINDAVSAPSQRATRTHRSEKPEPVLRHFFEAFVDDTTRVLDPTCGSGTSLVVADEMGVPYSVGVELDEENVRNARARFTTARGLRVLSEGGKP